jgi:hypothetical protein
MGDQQLKFSVRTGRGLEIKYVMTTRAEDSMDMQIFKPWKASNIPVSRKIAFVGIGYGGNEMQIKFRES